MENKKTKILTVLCVLLSIGFIGTAFAYYKEDTPAVTNTFIASGAGEMFDFDNEDPAKKGVFDLNESKATINSDGSYTLDETQRVTSNSYKVLPGVDIKKDPKITIKNKSEIPAYLYLEIKGDCSAYFTYTLTNEWTKLTGANGLHGGTVYLYSPAAGSVLGAVSSKEIYIINNNTLETNETLTATDELDLTFYAYLAQTGIGTETETYNTCFGVN